MAIFAVLSDKPNAALGARIAELYPRDFHELSGSQWLIVADSVPRALADELGVRDGAYGRAIVIRTAGVASGWQARSFWDWLRQKVEED